MAALAGVAAGSAPRPRLLRAARAGGGPASGRSPGRPGARGGARGLSPGAGEFWERPAQGGGPAAARAAVPSRQSAEARGAE